MATRPRAAPKSAAKVSTSGKRPAAAAKPEPSGKPVEAPKVRIFVSYSHKDEGARDKLQTHLAPWRHDDVSIWYDGNIDPGAELDPEIARELRRAHIFVALFTPAYLDSHYCWNIEYKRAMGRRARKLVRVVGVVAKPCGWKATRAAGFKLLPKGGIPPEQWSSTDTAYLNIAEGIGALIKTVRKELAAKAAAASQARSWRGPPSAPDPADAHVAADKRRRPDPQDRDL